MKPSDEAPRNRSRETVPRPLPTAATRPTLKRTIDLRCNPATVKVTRLRFHLFVIYVTRVHLARIKCNASLDGSEIMRGLFIAPRATRHRLALHLYVPIRGRSLAFTERPVRALA